jgi:tRNA threonylcarbamoyladenosine biosynthesis protein TsaE
MVKRRPDKGKRSLAAGPGCGSVAGVRTIDSRRPEDTFEAGRTLAASLAPGDCVALHGEIGAGKTHFVQGLLAGWGGDTAATSPTFTLLHEYGTPRGPVFHLDLYRAESAEEVWSAAQDELGAADGLVVIEWADRCPAVVPAGAWRVTIIQQGPGRREIRVEEPS